MTIPTFKNDYKNFKIKCYNYNYYFILWRNYCHSIPNYLIKILATDKLAIILNQILILVAKLDNSKERIF